MLEQGNAVEIAVHAEAPPQPRAKLYLTLPSPDSPFAVEGGISSVRGPGSPPYLREIGRGPVTVVQAARPGYYAVTASSPDGLREYNVFVSPVPSRHLDRTDRDWYVTQWRTVTTSNCGPTTASMALAWAKGLKVPVSEIRKMTGWKGGGGVSLEELAEVLRRHGVRGELLQVDRPEDLLAILASGRGLGLSYNMAGLEKTENPSENLFGQYYTDHGGHYLFLKGYSLDGRYVIVYDPIPSDWSSNSLRYADGESMLGRNRYYPLEPLFRAMTRNAVLAVSRSERD
jgi:hypothetical protein